MQQATKKYLLTGLLIASLLATSAAHSVPAKLRVVNGSPASEGAWPWMGLVVDSGDNPAEDLFICGATLVDRQYVLTAAHCVVSIGFRERPANIQVIMGRTLLSSDTGTRSSVERIIAHPKYNAFRFSPTGDIALLRLSAPLNSSTITLIKDDEGSLWTPGTNTTLLGWGQARAEFAIFPDNLQRATIPVVDDNTCSSSHGLAFNDKTMLCAGVLSSSSTAEDGIDSCSGDSGGPLLVQDGSTWKQIGVVSWGFDCASNEFVGVYTRVSAFSEWVRRTIESSSKVIKILQALPQKIRTASNVSLNSPIPSKTKRARRATRRKLARLQGIYGSFSSELASALPGSSLSKVKKLTRFTLRAMSLRISEENRAAVLRKIDRLVAEMLAA